MAEDNVTVIDAQADFEGKLRGKDALVRGRFKGEIELSGKLQLGEGSRVEATIKADAAEISGELKGDVKARSLILGSSAPTPRSTKILTTMKVIPRTRMTAEIALRSLRNMAFTP